ncbi:undecaprenyldiphospho-muramoylpentapeptide beta-N-acetylglucosaminyltransferase [Eubacteriales bacterium DFI.9.88]|nr:undecaprenyldiphospho-muramoylpentapeptide beta-N-acetylglucosaminyltransferase [Eubacteriales bacterium DFI.9.88]
MKVIMTGGGTGGHIYPAIAIADKLKERYPGSQILFVGTEHGLEKKIVPENGYPIEFITVAGFNRKNPLKNIEVMKKLSKGSKQAKQLIKAFDPDLVIGTGGYVCGPVVRAAHKAGIKTYTHEQNAFPGVTNKLLEKYVEKMFLGFPEAQKYFKHRKKHVICGNPVRSVFFNADRRASRRKLGFSEDDFILLVFGGSQGAGRINKAMLSVIEVLNGMENVQVCMATGTRYYDAILNELREERGVKLADNIHILEYISNMDEYLSASDLVISRSGALTVAEVTVCGKAAIFIPSPIVTGNHQYYNAKAVADHGGAVIIEEKDMDNEKLIAQIMKLKNDPQKIAEMSRRSKECAPMDAVEIICNNLDIQ